MFYVAMTRAKHCLALSSVQPGNSARAAGGTGWRPLVTEVDLQSQAPAHGAEPPPLMPDTFTIPSLPALPEAPANRPRAHRRRAGGRRPGGHAGRCGIDPLSRQGDAMHQLLEQAGVAGALLADVRAHGWPAARLARLLQTTTSPRRRRTGRPHGAGHSGGRGRLGLTRP